MTLICRTKSNTKSVTALSILGEREIGYVKKKTNNCPYHVDNQPCFEADRSIGWHFLPQQKFNGKE